jgi:hypothetical protein
MRASTPRARLASCLVVASASAAAIAGCGSSSSSSANSAVASAEAQASKLAQAESSGEATSSAAPADTAAAAAATPAAGGGAGKGNCQYLSLQQASSFEQTTYVATSRNLDGSCLYETKGGESTIPTGLILSVKVDKAPGCWTLAKVAVGHQARTIPGLGDAALGSTEGVAVKDGSACIRVDRDTVGDSTGDYGKDVAVAKAILADLS